MKTAAKIFFILTIIGMVFSIVFFAVFSIWLWLDFNALEGEEALAGSIPMVTLCVVFAIVAIACLVPLIINIIGLVVLNKAKEKSQVLPISIILLVLGVNLVSAIIMLCMKDEDFA